MKDQNGSHDLRAIAHKAMHAGNKSGAANSLSQCKTVTRDSLRCS